MMMLTAYCDESGTHSESPILAVGGLLAQGRREPHRRAGPRTRGAGGSGEGKPSDSVNASKLPPKVPPVVLPLEALGRGGLRKPSVLAIF